LNVAIVGCGEVGRCYASALGERGHRLSLLDPKPSPEARALSERLAASLYEAPGDWLSRVDLALSCVVGNASLSAARSCLGHMAAGATYGDMTTANPADVRLGGEEAAQRGIAFVDIAIMGAIALTGAQTPLLMAGAQSRSPRELFEDLGARVRVLDAGRAGDASSLKLLRSVFTKGLEGLAVECLLAAEKQGLRGVLYEILSDIDETPLRDFLEMLVRTHTVHAARRLHEVEESERQLALIGIRSRVLPGVRARFQHTADAIARAPLAAVSPNVADALSWLLLAESEKEAAP